MEKESTILLNFELPKGYYSLAVLAKKFGYVKDYVGWHSRTGKIKAIRYGKYGSWYASEESLADHVSCLISRPSGKKHIKTKLGNEETIFSRLENKNSVNLNPVESPAPHVYTAESVIQPDPTQHLQDECGDKVLSLPRQSLLNESGPTVLSINQYLVDESSFSAEKIKLQKLTTKRINAVFIASVLLGGILVLLQIFQPNIKNLTWFVNLSNNQHNEFLRTFPVAVFSESVANFVLPNHQSALILSQPVTRLSNRQIVAKLSDVFDFYDEALTITTIDEENIGKLSFLNKAKSGDKLIVLQNSGKAILYDPEADKILNFGLLSEFLFNETKEFTEQ